MLRQVKLLSVLLTLFILSACSSVGKYVLPTHQFVGAVIVSNDVNPNLENRPSPISLYFFQLKGADTFNSADFFSLYDNPQKALGGDYLDMGKIDLAPGSHTEVSFVLTDDTKFVGVIAAYQQLPRAVWRAIVPMDSWGKERVYVNVNRLAVVMTKIGGDSTTSSTDLGSLAKQAKSTASSGSGGGSSGSGSGSWKDKLVNQATGNSNSGGSSSSGSSGSGGGIMQRYNDAKSAVNGGSSSNSGGNS